MKNVSWVVGCLMAGLVAVNLLVTGCESTSSVEEVITVTPASANLTSQGATASFVASATSTTNPLVLPLEWNIARGDLGKLLTAEGVTAIYESNGKLGNNTLTVKDKIGQTGVAVINQVEPEDTTADAAETASLPEVEATLP